MFEIESDEFSGRILSNRQIFFIPPNIGQMLPNITEFSVTYCGLLALNNNAFEGMNELKLINASWNKISEIESKTFTHLKNLEILDLSHNFLRSFDFLIFKGLVKLEKLQLNHNNLSIIHSHTFSTLLNLSVLDLSFNTIKKLQVETFAKFNTIKEFYINDNQLETMSPEIIVHFAASNLIDLRNNQCIDRRYPDNFTMVQLGIEVSGKVKHLWLSNSLLIKHKLTNSNLNKSKLFKNKI